MILSKTLLRYERNMVRLAGLAVAISLIPAIVILDVAVWYVGLKTTNE